MSQGPRNESEERGPQRGDQQLGEEAPRVDVVVQHRLPRLAGEDSLAGLEQGEGTELDDDQRAERSAQGPTLRRFGTAAERLHGGSRERGGTKDERRLDGKQPVTVPRRQQELVAQARVGDGHQVREPVPYEDRDACDSRQLKGGRGPPHAHVQRICGLGSLGRDRLGRHRVVQMT
jgi:hypothetical protein